MKFTRIITFSIISALSIGTLVGVAEVNKAPIDRKFTIKDEKGNREALGGVTLQNTIKVDTNKYEKMALTKDKVTFQKTKYDPIFGVGEKVLNNKDLYRGMNYAVDYENDKFTMVAKFNPKFPYGSNETFVTIAKKDKKTNNLQKEQISVTGITTNQQIDQEMLFENNGVMYYGVVLRNWSANSSQSLLRIYQIQQNNLHLKEVTNVELSLPGSDYTDISRIVVDEKKLFMVLSNQQAFKLLTVDFATNKSEKLTLPMFSKDNTYVEAFSVDENNFYISVNSTVFAIDKKTYLQVNKEAMKPSFLSNYEYIRTVNLKTDKETIYVLYEAYKNNNQGDMFIVAYEMKSGKTLYEGKLPSMTDRGVGESFTFADKE
ncbi:hypothetical protein [Bacillus massiliigorillae]|uniref:hypothetical protein n=1 Tax=Bacillus massiliigorillae TaxID=1243664 RepID=UPI0003A73B95|nr:hypothetical protein [Bacillus massiliigorillae]